MANSETEYQTMEIQLVPDFHFPNARRVRQHRPDLNRTKRKQIARQIKGRMIARWLSFTDSLRQAKEANRG